MENVTVKTENHEGYKFSDFYPLKRGEKCWHVFGRNSEKYGKLENGKGAYVMLVAHPTKGGNKLAGVPGWETRREADNVARNLRRRKAR